MTKRIAFTIIAAVFVLAASVAWADHIDDEIAKQQSVIDQGTASGKIDSYDSVKLNHYLNRIKKRTIKLRQKGRYTQQEIKKIEIYLQRSKAEIQKATKK